MSEDDRQRLISYAVAGIVAIVSLAAGVFFLVEAVGLLATQPPHVTASIMSAIVGLALLSAATSISRTLLLARAAERGAKTGRDEGGA